MPVPASRFRRNPRPDADVIEALEKALRASRLGHVRAVAIITVNPLHEIDTLEAGNIEAPFRDALIAGLARAAHRLLAENDPPKQA